jgi:tetratricopeptide (TPR) repeat protein
VQVEGHLWDDLQSVFSYGKTVGPGVLCKMYSTFVDSLIHLEKNGLSGSIYTQPYDVEGEQNGLMTYDRETVKIPVGQIRDMHLKLWPSSGNMTSTIKSLNLKLADTLLKNYDIRLQEYNAGVRDSASLRALAFIAYQKKDAKIATEVSRDYIKSVNDPLTETNVRFIQNFVKDSKDPGYSILLNNLKKIATFMETKTASAKVQGVIYREQVKQLLTEIPKWNSVDSIIHRYPQLDGEFILGNCVVYYINATRRNEKNALKNFIEVAEKYVDRYHTGAYNTWAWEIFEATTDKKDLGKALEWSSKAILENPDDANSFDTYANILHKLGRTEEAIIWEEKAIAINPNESIFKEVLQKMKAGQATWSTN